MSSRSEQEVVREQVINAMIRRCKESLVGLGQSIRLAITTDLDELRLMSMCEEFPHGLDFSTGDHTARAHLYDGRDGMQDQQVYFIGERRLGIKWSCFPPTGIGWRVGEFFERAQPMAHQIAAWCGIEAARIENADVAKKLQGIGERFRNVDQELKELRAETDAVLTMIPGALIGQDQNRKKRRKAA